MKNFLTLLILLFITFVTFSVQAQAPNIKGQAQAANFYAPNIQFPNNQVTKVNGITAFAETGNSDILKNGSFESTINPKDGWTTSPSTPTLELSDTSDNKQAICFSPSSEPLEVSQDSTLNATAFADGTLQGLARGRVKIIGLTAGQKVFFSPRRAGAIVTSLQKEVTANGLWQQMEMSFTLGGTSNGISVHSEGYGNITATKICVDGMKVETNVKVTGETGVVGPWIAFTPTSTWVAGANHFGSYRQVGDSAEIQYNLSLTGTPTATTLTLAMPNGLTIDTAKIPSAGQSYTPVGTGQGFDASSTGGYSFQVTISGSNSFLPLYQNSLTGQQQVLTATQPLTWAVGDRAQFTVTVPIKEFAASTSTYLGTNGDTSWASCGHTPGDFQGFGAVTGISTQCKREGGDLLMRGIFTSGAPTAAEARVNLKLNGTALTSASSLVSSLAGLVAISQATNDNQYILIDPTVTYLNFSEASTGTSGLTKANGSSIITASGQFVSLEARIPIAGWENSNLMIAELSGLQKCTDTWACTNTVTARVDSAGQVYDDTLDFINGNFAITSTSVYTATYNTGKFTATPTCVFTPINTSGSGFLAQINSHSSTGIVVNLKTDSGGNVASGFNISCTKNGTDLVSATAKAVASDQNTRTPGVLNGGIYSFVVSNTGVVTDDIGDLINGNCGAASNAFTCNFNSNRFSSASGFSPTCIGNSYGGLTNSIQIVSQTSALLSYNTSGSGAASAQTTRWFCFGIIQ